MVSAAARSIGIKSSYQRLLWAELCPSQLARPSSGPQGQFTVESRCGAVALGSAYL